MGTVEKRVARVESQASNDIRQHRRSLGHEGRGVTELRVFDPRPKVAYADSEDAVIGLCLEMDGKTSGVYMGVQPRPLDLFDSAPNCWRSARSGRDGNCTYDKDIEFVTTIFFDIDVVSTERAKGYPASENELQRTLEAAKLLIQEEGLALSSVICCSGNGYYVLARLVPMLVYDETVAAKLRQFCTQLAAKVAARVAGVKFDPVYNLSRVMRVMGTVNGKGQPVPGRPHRRAHFVTEPVQTRSMALHHMIVNTEISKSFRVSDDVLPEVIQCDLRKIEDCAFIKWCRSFPEQVSQPQWFAMITNLARLEGGTRLIHEISALDKFRYDHSNTQQVIERVLDAGYKPVSCKTLVNAALGCPDTGRFTCSKINRCPANAPMYMATLHTVYKS